MRPSLISRVSLCRPTNCGLRQAAKITSILALSTAAPQTTPLTRRLRPSQQLLRQFAISHRANTMNQDSEPHFAAGSDDAALATFLTPLLTANGGRWTLTNNGQALEREFKFKTFAKTWDFMTAVSLQCKVKNHHPEWSNVYNTTFIRWTTHHPKGLSDKDIELATICDRLAQDFGETAVVAEAKQPQHQQQAPAQDVQPGQQTQQGEQDASCGLAGLANRAVGSAGDCCVPKGKGTH